MLVYSDHVEIADPGERLREFAEQLSRIATLPAGIDRHAKLVATLVDAGQLLQGVADAGWPDEQPLSAFIHRLALCVVRSWDSGFAETGELPSGPTIQTTGDVTLRLPEGFAYYAVYPEAYIEAARRLSLSGPPRVIGIRSIGTTLGGIVAATLGAPRAVTVRPRGDPFARQVDLPADLLNEDAHYVIVDEGPGLSGSSFGAVADRLEEGGVPLERIAFLPSHDGPPGPQGSEAHRRRWKRARRVPGDFDGRVLELARGWAGELLRPNDVLTFVGLGQAGELKLEMAHALHSAALTREPVGLVHGFLIERGSKATGLAPGEKPIGDIAHYIVARANLFPAEPGSGASIERLLEMCRRNISLAIGDQGGGSHDQIVGKIPKDRVRRVRTDNRMDRKNWLRAADGRLIKVDAVNHHQAHDLIGCQHLAWDVAGAIAEFALTSAEAEALIRAVEQRGPAIDPELLAFYRIAYLAFRLGQATLAQELDAQRYAGDLRRLLHQHVCSGTPQDSSVG